MITTPREFTLPFLRREKLSEDTWAFYFDRRKDPFDFLPGQWVRITLAIKNPDKRGASRIFSLASSPLENEYALIATRIIESAFKKKLMELVPQTPVRFFGPSGQFILAEAEKIPQVFLAGGIGITPFRSMLVYALQKKLAIPLTLLASFANVEDIVFQNELEEIGTKHPSIRIVYTVSKPQEPTYSGAETGRISEELIRKYTSDVAGSLYYIAGPPLMVSAMEQIVEEMGISQNLIRKENFVGY